MSTNLKISNEEINESMIFFFENPMGFYELLQHLMSCVDTDKADLELRDMQRLESMRKACLKIEEHNNIERCSSILKGLNVRAPKNKTLNEMLGLIEKKLLTQT